MGPFPTESLARRADLPDLSAVPLHGALDFAQAEDAQSIIHAMADYQAMLDAIRAGTTNPVRAAIPEDAQARADHLKSFGYFADAAVVGVCPLPQSALLETPLRNPALDRLAEVLNTRQTKTLAAGIDVIMADLCDSIATSPGPVSHHGHAVVLMYENPRPPGAQEPGTGWLRGAQVHRAGLRAAETAVVLAEYIRLLGFDARAHTVACADVDLNRLAVAAGLATPEEGVLRHPYLGTRFGLAAVTTALALAPDRPLAPLTQQPRRAFGIGWRIGGPQARNASNAVPFAGRRFVDGAHPFETLKRVDNPTTYIDAARVARVPKRTDMFARAQFGDLGKAVQKGAAGGYYTRKAAPSMAQRRALGALLLLQDGTPAAARAQVAPQEAADLVKATAYWLGCDAVGISACPDWTWYSHDARGDPITPPHDQAISIIIDQGHETMEGASGDDWISVAQSMRAYLRFSLLGGVIAQQIRNLGYAAKAHTVLDGEVLQPPLLLLAGLGEVSRIGEVILNPFLGPRLKSGVVTTDLPMTHDRPIDFGLQKFCEACKKCARECPSGAITAGPKLMFNGYEIWKSDSQKCATYRITTPGGAMCGRCMKTCPWNLEGLFAEKPFRWAAMNVPAAAPVLARLDDALGRGGLNPVKKWWWDLELDDSGGYLAAKAPVNARGLQKDLKLHYEDQTLAVYPANLAPHPAPFPQPMDREAGIAAYRAMISAQAYRAHLRAGTVEQVAHRYAVAGESPMLQVEVTQAEEVAAGVMAYTLRAPDGGDLPRWEAGAHLDVVVAPEFLRQYSLCGDPADRSCYRIAVLREEDGRGGSKLMQRVFKPGRRVFVSRPIEHFQVAPQAAHVLLMGGGIGITPMMAMAHALQLAGRSFALHYSGRARAKMAFLPEIARAPWAARAHVHISEEGSRADLAGLFADLPGGTHAYICGAQPYMDAVMAAAIAGGLPEDALHTEYFSVPDLPERVNHPFTLRLARSGRTLTVPADRAATDVLADHGVPLDVKCADGLCGVCQCTLLSGEVEHRDFVLSNAQRATKVILCQSRAARPGGVIEVDL